MLLLSLALDSLVNAFLLAIMRRYVENWPSTFTLNFSKPEQYFIPIEIVEKNVVKLTC